MMPLPKMPPKRFDDLVELGLELEVVTPIFGGAPVPRNIDSIDVIRPASIRGHLRFWWRALHAQDYETSPEIYLAEARLWGGPSSEGREKLEGVGRSRVELRVECRKPGGETRADSFEDRAGAYALFPGRPQRGDGTPAARMRFAGTRFQLQLRFPPVRAREVRDSLRAWVLFGGYGGRTRRGLGSLRVVGDDAAWLPTAPNKRAIEALFGREIFAAPKTPAGQTPLLAGARLFSSYEEGLPSWTWQKAVSWLVDFRQGSATPRGARQPGAKDRPSISNWPEADKVRHLSHAELPWAHPPRHNERPAWPRAGFGLPIVGQFQTRDRDKKLWERRDPPLTEPDEFQIGWRAGGELHDRLASPLILKPLALASGGGKARACPIALWLNRAHPAGEVVLTRKGEEIPGSAAPFETLTDPDDPVFFDGLVGHERLDDALFAWLDKHARPQRTRRDKNKGKRKQRRRRR